MENVIPKYVRPIAKIDDPINKVSFWDEAIDAFDEKKYKETVLAVINYINPNLLEGKNTDGDVEITQMQGSAEINVKITETTFSIKAPFLRISDKTNKVALLRKVAEVNFSPLRLAQIHQNKDALFFEYEMPIELSQPNKVYDIIRNVAVYADDYDDLFINKYHAEFYKKPAYKELSAAEQEQVWQQITAIFEDYKNYTVLFKEKRWDDFIWDLLVISMLKISNMPYVHGKLRSDLIEYVGKLFNSDLDFNYRVDKGVNFMKKLINTPKEDLMNDVYHAEHFISLRWRSNPQAITDRLKNNMERVQDYEKQESHFSVSYYLQFIFLKLIYDYNLEDNYKQAIYNVLEKVSGLEPSDAAPKLIKVFYAMQDGSINNQETKKEKKGFFSKLFN
jgi:hypothetical protein